MSRLEELKGQMKELEKEIRKEKIKEFNLKERVPYIYDRKPFFPLSKAGDDGLVVGILFEDGSTETKTFVDIEKLTPVNFVEDYYKEQCKQNNMVIPFKKPEGMSDHVYDVIVKILTLQACNIKQFDVYVLSTYGICFKRNLFTQDFLQYIIDLNTLLDKLIVDHNIDSVLVHVQLIAKSEEAQCMSDIMIDGCIDYSKFIIEKHKDNEDYCIIRKRNF